MQHFKCRIILALVTGIVGCIVEIAFGDITLDLRPRACFFSGCVSGTIGVSDAQEVDNSIIFFLDLFGGARTISVINTVFCI
jgi:hypothetical protein